MPIVRYSDQRIAKQLQGSVYVTVYAQLRCQFQLIMELRTYVIAFRDAVQQLDQVIVDPCDLRCFIVLVSAKRGMLPAEYLLVDCQQAQLCGLDTERAEPATVLHPCL